MASKWDKLTSLVIRVAKEGEFIEDEYLNSGDQAYSEVSYT